MAREREMRREKAFSGPPYRRWSRQRCDRDAKSQSSSNGIAAGCAAQASCMRLLLKNSVPLAHRRRAYDEAVKAAFDIGSDDRNYRLITSGIDRAASIPKLGQWSRILRSAWTAPARKQVIS